MMTRSFALAGALLLGAAISLGQQDPRRTLLVRIDSVKADDLLKSGVVSYDEYQPRGILSLVRDTALVLMTHAEAALVRERGFRSTVVMEDTSELTLVRRAAYGPTLRLEPPYHTYAQIRRAADSLAKANPSLVRVFQVGVTTQRRQPIIGVEVSAKAKEGVARPAILINGCHHSNELLGAEISLALLHDLAAKYGRDPQITRWLESFQIVIVPVVNADGHDVVTSGEDPRWRKNRRDTNGDGEVRFPEGVDINRNYDFNWAHGGSEDPESERYRGEFPFSESENVAIASLAREKRFLCSLTYHSQGEVIFYPWNWGGRKAPDDQLLTSMARNLGRSITTMRGDTCYRAEYGAGLVGQSYPWLYGVLGTFDFVVETGRGASFVPPHEVDGIVRANLQGVYALLRRTEGPGLSVRVRDASTGAPLEAEVWFPKIETEDIERRTSHPRSGILWRLLSPGSYELIVSKEGYQPVVLKDIQVGESGWTAREVRLHNIAKR